MKRLNPLLSSVIVIGSCFAVQAQDTEILVHKAEQTTIVNHISVIDDANFNNKEFLYPVFTHNLNPNAGPGKAVTKEQGLYYAEKKWGVYTEDLSNFPLNTSYNLLWPSIGTSSWRHYTEESNITNNYTVIDHPKINEDPDALLFVSHMFNTNGAVGSFHQDQIGVFYQTSIKKWAIFNQGKEAMDEEVAFNIVVLSSPDNFDAFVHQTDGNSIKYNMSVLDHAKLNNNPSARIIVTQLWNPGGSGGKYNNHPIGVYYDGTHWTIYNEDDEDMNLGVGFNVLIINDEKTNNNKEIMEIPSLRVGPNPVDQGKSVTIGLYNENNQNIKVELLDLQGKVLVSQNLDAQHVVIHRLSTAGIPKGIYILSVSSKRVKAIRRIVIQ